MVFGGPATRPRSSMPRFGRTFRQDRCPWQGTFPRFRSLSPMLCGRRRRGGRSQLLGSRWARLRPSGVPLANDAGVVFDDLPMSRGACWTFFEPIGVEVAELRSRCGREEQQISIFGQWNEGNRPDESKVYLVEIVNDLWEQMRVKPADFATIDHAAQPSPKSRDAEAVHPRVNPAFELDCIDVNVFLLVAGLRIVSVRGVERRSSLLHYERKARGDRIAHSVQNGGRHFGRRRDQRKVVWHCTLAANSSLEPSRGRRKGRTGQRQSKESWRMRCGLTVVLEEEVVCFFLRPGQCHYQRLALTLEPVARRALTCFHPWTARAVKIASSSRMELRLSDGSPYFRENDNVLQLLGTFPSPGFPMKLHIPSKLFLVPLRPNQLLWHLASGVDPQGPVLV